MRYHSRIHTAILRHINGDTKINLSSYTWAQINAHEKQLIKLGYIRTAVKPLDDGNETVGFELTDDGIKALAQQELNLNPY